MQLLKTFGKIDLSIQGNRWSLYQENPLYLNLIREERFIRAFPTDMGGGIAGGDEQIIRLNLKDARMIWQPAGSTICYPNRLGDCSDTLLENRIDVQGNSTLFYLNKPLIPCSQSRINQKTRIILSEEASLFYFEPYAAGRVSSGYRWDFESFQSELEVIYREKPVLKERWRLDGGQIPGGMAGFQDCSWWATLLVIGKPMVPVLSDYLNRIGSSSLIYAVSDLADGVQILKMLDVSGTEVTRSLYPIGEKYFNDMIESV